MHGNTTNTRQEAASHSSSKNFASMGTTTRTIALVLSLAIVLFEVLPTSNMASVTTAKMTSTKVNTISSSLLSSSLSTIKPLKTMYAANANQVVASYGVRLDSDEHIVIVVFNLSRANNSKNNGTTFGTDRQPSSYRDSKKFIKRILVVDDEPDIVLAFKVSLDGYYCDDKRRFEVHTYNNPLEALSEFKPNFYDLLLVDVYMPGMNGFEVSQKILEADPNSRVCFISAVVVNIEALREIYPKLSFECFIKKPVEIEYLVERLNAELD
jgi:CheY-like chemotaxis protein